MTLTEARKHIGAQVVYQGNPDQPAEDGTIVRVNEVYIFVRYRGYEHPMATYPRDLKLLAALDGAP